ncbi:hypothetical protein GCM10011367_01940 [Marinicauda pacifica]|uniref:hypothetical protein n=1 Tax=Marinicauda pacifica TaxID=1133559 RepID=UPI0019CC1AFF|nr:hypothetical protein [Marinicauda pacifica]GGE31187.1 hypothetical protein GCM10011367_01940 [Marinicauda pacifica]
MKTLTLAATALLGASALAPAMTPSAEAQSYRAAPATTYEQCVQQQRQRQVAGAVIGGILGAVVGAELHDESQDRDRDRYRGHRGYDDRYGYSSRGYRHSGYRHDRRSRHDRYGRHDEAGNDGAVVAGGAVGALAGAAIASGNCDQLRYGQSGYGQSDPYRQTGPVYDQGYGQGYGQTYDQGYGDDYGYDDPYYGSDPVYDDRYDNSRRYSTNEELLGGSGYGYSDQQPAQDSRRYSAGSQTISTSGYQTASCRYMSSAGREVYMCQGSDGMWRPAQ